MAINLSKADHKSLDRMLDGILNAFKNNEVTLPQARGALAHVFTAAAIGNETEVRSWLTPEVMNQWREDLKNG